MVASLLAALAMALALSAAPLAGGVRMDAASEIQPDASPHEAEEAQEVELPKTWSDEHRDVALNLLGKWQDQEQAEHKFEVKKGPGALRLHDVASGRFAELRPCGEVMLKGDVDGKLTRFSLNLKTKKLSVERYGETTLGYAWTLVDNFKPAEKQVQALRQVWTSELSPTEVALADNLLGKWEHGVTTASKLDQSLSKYLGFSDRHAFHSLAFNVTKSGDLEVQVDEGKSIPLKRFGAVFEGDYSPSAAGGVNRFYLAGDGRLTVESKAHSSDWAIHSTLAPVGRKPAPSTVKKQHGEAARGEAAKSMVSLTVMVAVFGAWCSVA